MECDKDEYRCIVSFSTAYDPVNITPTTFLYDRNTAETWVEKKPRKTTIPHTRQPFVASHITPNVALRAEMREYFQNLMGAEYTGWEVIPDYPQLLSLPDITELLAQVNQYFPREEAELREMSPDRWSAAWKRLNYLRLNLQLNPLNRQQFLSDEAPISRLAEIIVLSYSLDAKGEESGLFHREVLRTIRALDLTTHPLRAQLKPENESECDRFKGFLLRNFLLKDEGLLPIVLDLLVLASETIVDDDAYHIFAYILDANPKTLSSTDLKNLARILADFSLFTRIGLSTFERHIGILKKILGAFVQILVYTIGKFSNFHRIGIVEDAYEALNLSLFWLREILQCAANQSQEARLSFIIENNLWTHIHEIMTLVIERQSVHRNNLSVDHWLNLLLISKILFENLGSADLMTEEVFRLYHSLLQAPFSGEPFLSDYIKSLLEEILQMFRDLVDVDVYTASINEE